MHTLFTQRRQLLDQVEGFFCAALAPGHSCHPVLTTFSTRQSPSVAGAAQSPQIVALECQLQDLRTRYLSLQRAMENEFAAAIASIVGLAPPPSAAAVQVIQSAQQVDSCLDVSLVLSCLVLSCLVLSCFVFFVDENLLKHAFFSACGFFFFFSFSFADVHQATRKSGRASALLPAAAELGGTGRGGHAKYRLGGHVASPAGRCVAATRGARAGMSDNARSACIFYFCFYQLPFVFRGNSCKSLCVRSGRSCNRRCIRS